MPFATLRRFLLGSPIPTARESHERLSKVKGLAVFSSDALSSVAYATEEILRVLVLAGTAALVLSVPIAVSIAVVLVLVAISYFQTIHAYPRGGGSYIVAHENLGEMPGLVAASSLLIDYTLTVAVSVTAGMEAITSAVPALIPLRIELCLAAIALIAWANLRGVRESGTIFAIPTYAFIAITLTLIVSGFLKVATTGAVPPPAHIDGGGTQALTLFLILRAFASGCTALTGIEAISDGIPAFKPPESRNAGRTLVAMATLLVVMFLGITFLARDFGIAIDPHETVVSQIGRAVFGTGALYYILQAATAMILLLAGNTAFADFPRLGFFLARDRYLPRQLANRGDRLVFTNGILTLAILAGALIVAFGGTTHALIPLYAVGVFVSFSLSQAGMVRHWMVRKTRGWQWKMALNAVGLSATAVVALVIIATKFLHGAWIVLALIPLAVASFKAINRHYADAQALLSVEGLEPRPWKNPATHVRHKVVVPVSGVHRGTLAALEFARSMSADVVAVTADIDPKGTERLRADWKRWGNDVPLVVLESPYRSTVAPLIDYLEEVDKRPADHALAVVVIPEFVPAKIWQKYLHNQTARLLKDAILYREGRKHDRIIISVPFHLSR
jgi:amino acid transporter